MGNHQASSIIIKKNFYLFLCISNFVFQINFSYKLTVFIPKLFLSLQKIIFHLIDIFEYSVGEFLFLLFSLSMIYIRNIFLRFMVCIIRFLDKINSNKMSAKFRIFCNKLTKRDLNLPKPSLLFNSSTSCNNLLVSAYSIHG